MTQSEQFTAIKTFSDKLFIVYNINADGYVLAQHSGTYAVDKSDLTETILHTSGNKAMMLGVNAVLTFGIEGNKLKISGKVGGSDTVPFAEEWVRMDSEEQLKK